MLPGGIILVRRDIHQVIEVSKAGIQVFLQIQFEFPLNISLGGDNKPLYCPGPSQYVFNQPGKPLRPDTIRLRFEPLESKTLPVRVATRGTLPDGLVLALPIHTSPALVEVRGPAGDLDELDSVPLFPVDLTGLRSAANVPASVDTVTLAGLRVSPRDVNVLLRVVPVDSQAVPRDPGRRGPRG